MRQPYDGWDDKIEVWFRACVRELALLPLRWLVFVLRGLAYGLLALPVFFGLWKVFPDHEFLCMAIALAFAFSLLPLVKAILHATGTRNVPLRFQVYQGQEATTLDSFLDECGNLPYRNLIESWVRRMSATDLLLTSKRLKDFLSTRIHAKLETLVDLLNKALVPDKEFWQRANCLSAFGRITSISAGALEIDDLIGPDLGIAAAATGERSLGYDLFMFATLSFAYAASREAKVRKLMGIRKGFFT